MQSDNVACLELSPGWSQRFTMNGLTINNSYRNLSGGLKDSLISLLQTRLESLRFAAASKMLASRGLAFISIARDFFSWRSDD